MFTEKEILDIIHQKIRTDEKLGDQTGGSGHKGHPAVVELKIVFSEKIKFW